MSEETKTGEPEPRVKLTDLKDHELIAIAKKATNPTQVWYQMRSHVLKEMIRRFDPKKAKLRAQKAAHKAATAKPTAE